MATSKERRANNVELKSGQFDFTVEFASKKEDNSPIFDKFLQTPKIDPITDNANYRVSACLDSVSGNIIIRETYVLVQNGTCNLELTLSSNDGSFVLGLALNKPGILKSIDTETRLITRPISGLRMRSHWKMEQVHFVKIRIKNASANPKWEPEKVRAVLNGFYMTTPKASVTSPSQPPTPAPLAVVATSATVDDSKAETVEIVDTIYPALIPLSAAASQTAAILILARRAKLARTLEVKDSVLQQVEVMRESLMLQDEAWERTAEAIRGLEESTIPFLCRKAKELEGGEWWLHSMCA